MIRGRSKESLPEGARKMWPFGVIGEISVAERAELAIVGSISDPSELVPGETYYINNEGTKEPVIFETQFSTVRSRLLMISVFVVEDGKKRDIPSLFYSDALGLKPLSNGNYSSAYLTRS